MNSWTENLSSGRYLYIEDTSSDGSYESKMASAVTSPYLLAPSAVFMERKACFEYSISGLVSLDEYMTGKNIGSEDIISLLTQIDTAAAVVQNYLLSESSLLIDPDHVYADKQKKELKICVVPEYNGCFEEELKQLILRIVPHINTDDSIAMRTGIRLMRAVSKNDYKLHDVLEMLNNDGSAQNRGFADIGGANAYDRDRNEQADIREISADRAYMSSGSIPNGYAGSVNNAGICAKYGEPEQISASHVYGYNNDDIRGSAAGIPADAFTSRDMQNRKSFGVKADRDATAARKYTDAPEDEQDDAAGTQIGESITGMLISQAILAGIAVMVFLVKGKSVVLRLLPIYAIMAVCLLLYYIAGIVIRRRKARG